MARRCFFDNWTIYNPAPFVRQADRRTGRLLSVETANVAIFFHILVDKSAEILFETLFLMKNADSWNKLATFAETTNPVWLLWQSKESFHTNNMNRNDQDSSPKSLDNQNLGLFKWSIMITDLLVLNAYTVAYVMLWGQDPSRPKSFMLAINLALLLSVTIFPPVITYTHTTRVQVVFRALRTTVLFALVSLPIFYFIDRHFLGMWKILAIYYAGYFVVLTIERLVGKGIIRRIRKSGRNMKHVIFVGDTSNLKELLREMRNDPAYKYWVLGYFADQPKDDFLDDVPYIGQVDKLQQWMTDYDGQVDAVFCSLPSSRNEEIKKIIDFCDDQVVMFYHVPNVRNYLKRPMHIAFYGDVPVLFQRNMPLSLWSNRVKKRTFDIIVSSLFLLLFFWWILIIVAIIMKITMPGPIFFKQKRSGLDGKDFWCYKFRSMKVNKDADKVQATKDDPRKTKFGNLMRHLNIDELPQFWNVLKGDMSVVGPRPHMLLHTDMYSKLIPKYMVRHFCKPGITGWAQVTGSRGETEELWQMEERVEKDIWYIEHWGLSLDVRIMWLTFYNVITNKDAKAY